MPFLKGEETMKVKAIINYYDKDLKRDIKAGVIYDVESEERLKELLGANDKHLICCEVLKESETKVQGIGNEETNPKGTKKNAKRK